MLSHNEGTGRVDFSFDPSVDADGSIKVDDAFEIDILRQQRKILEIRLG
jgi:hypothetical protein